MNVLTAEMVQDAIRRMKDAPMCPELYCPTGGWEEYDTILRTFGPKPYGMWLLPPNWDADNGYRVD